MRLPNKLFGDCFEYNNNSFIDEQKQYCDNKQKWILLLSKDNKPTIPYKKRVFAYSNDSFSRTMKEKCPALTSWITDAIKKNVKEFTRENRIYLCRLGIY